MAIDVVGGEVATAGNSFTTIQPDTGTSPVADSATDTLTLTSSDGSIVIEGDATTDTIDLRAVAASAVTSVNGDAGPAVTLDADDLADGTAKKMMLAAERTKLSGIATGATANDTDANLKARANHTGTQLAATISDFQATVSANTDLIGKQTLLGNSRNLFVGYGAYSTIQAAVDAAELLAGSSDVTGVTVHIPAGAFTENVIVRKNVNLKGAGPYKTVITSVTYRPVSAVSCPTKVRIDGVGATTFGVYNQTAAASGIFCLGMFSDASDGGLFITNSRLETPTFRAIGRLDIHYSELVGTIRFYNVAQSDVTYSNSNSDDMLISGNDADTNEIFGLGATVGNYFTYTELGFLEVTKAGGTEDPFIGISNGYISNILANANTTVNVVGTSLRGTVSGVGTVNLDPALGYKPTTPADWSVAPTNLLEALDTLASSKAPKASPAFTGTVTGITSSMVGAEPALGNPSTNGYVLSSTTAGVRSWVATGGGSAPSDAAYGVSWNGDTTNSASKNAIYDKVELLDADITALEGASHTHSNAAVLNATTASFLLADETKLDGIATGATANSTDAQLRDRTTHTGAQAISTITGLQTALDAKLASADFVRKRAGAGGATQTTTSVTAANVTNMSFTIGANEAWTFEFNMQHGCNNTGGLKYAITIPSGTLRAHAIGASTGITATTSAIISASGTLTGVAYNTVNSQGGYARISGTVVAGVTGGTVQLQFASGTAGQTSTIYGESQLNAAKVS